jgi:subtilisin-like proprotein convertase family protein
MLQVNPRLDIRGVKHILARTCVKVDPTDQGWITNGAGYHFNPNYGFGLIDADAATRLAATFTQPPVEIAYTTGTVHVGATILDNVAVGVMKEFHMAGPAPLETVELTVDITHNYPGDLYIRLTSPMGTNSELTWDHTYLAYEMTGLQWTFSSAAFWGEDVTGDWTIQVADRWEGEAGLWNSYNFTAYAGVPEPATLALLAAGAAFAAVRRRRSATRTPAAGRARAAG